MHNVDVIEPTPQTRLLYPKRREDPMSLPIRLTALRHVWRLVAIGLLLAGCSDPAGAPLGTPAPVTQGTEGSAELGDALPEDDPIGALQQKLEIQEAGTFAGLWIEHEPEYRVVVAFTRDGEEAIRPYVEDTPLAGVIEVRPAEAALAELKQAQQEAHDLVREAGLTASSEIMVDKNRVELYVTDRALFDATLAAAAIQLPALVDIITIYTPLGADLPFDVTPDPTVHFPQFRMRSSAFMEALLQGRLVLQNGCLRVVAGDLESGYLVIWQTDYFLNNNAGALEILNRDGQVVARVGQEIALGGGEVPLTAELERNLREPLAGECQGPYWLMGEIASAGGTEATPTLEAMPGQELATPSASDSPFRSAQHHLEVTLPPGWSGAEGPETVSRTYGGVVAFNSWGQYDAWISEFRAEYDSSSGPPHFLKEVPDAAAYVALLHRAGGPVPVPWDYGPEYDRSDLADLWKPHDCRAAGGHTSVQFFKWGRKLYLEVQCGPGASEATTAAVNALLASWRFDRVPAGDPGWASSTARTLLPSAVGPDRFPIVAGTHKGGEPNRSMQGDITASRTTETRLDGDTVVVTFEYRWYGQGEGFAGDCPADRCHWWRFEAHSDGTVELPEEGGAAVPGMAAPE
jgi:hypothetical protein